MEPYEWMVNHTRQNEWIARRGLLIWLAEVFNGLAGGLYLVSCYFGSAEGMALGWLMIVLLKGGLHVLYLGKPLRFWRMAANPGTSWLSRGFILVGLFVVLGALQIAVSQWMPGSAAELVLKGFAGLTVFLLVMNTGFVMNCVNAIPFWNTAMLPLLFISCGILDGLGLIMALGLYERLGAAPAESAARLFLIVNALLIAVYLWSASYAGAAGKQPTLELVKGRLAALLWIGVFLCGILVPLMISVATWFDPALSSSLLIPAILCEMAGAFSLKYAILRSGTYRTLIPV
jgi:sulfite dehydrogenase (quinone) subunit SoeC